MVQLQEVTEIGGNRHLAKGAHAGPARVAARYAAHCRPDGAARNSQELSDNLAQVAPTPPDSQHPQVSEHVRSDMPLTEHVCTFQVCEGAAEVVAREREFH